MAKLYILKLTGCDIIALNGQSSNKLLRFIIYSYFLVFNFPQQEMLPPLLPRYSNAATDN